MKKITSAVIGIFVFAVGMAMMTPSAHAYGGWWSGNRVRIHVEHNTTVNQTTVSDVTTVVEAKSSTGGNEVKHTVFGDASVETGDATTNVTVTTTTGGNVVIL
jgi:hypothetical protein